MNIDPLQVPGGWSKDALLNNAQLYVEQMHTFAHDDWRFVFGSTLALELLARAALAHISPALLADPKDWNNTLHALGMAPKATKFVPRSIDVSHVIFRIQEIVPEFTPELGGFAQAHISRRNEELHSGNSPLDGLKSSSWLPLYYRTCQVLLTSIGARFETYVGQRTAQAAVEMIAASLDDSAKAVIKAINAHRAVWEAREAPERLRGADRASIWAIKQTGHRVKCPACDCDALLSGAPIDAPIRTIDGDEITEVQQKLPSRFECIACGLKISGLPQLAACGLGDAYKTTSIYDAAEYYAPDDDYSGFEPDNNEP